MKRITIAAVIVFCSNLVFSQGIQFETSTLADALKKAKAENKMVFIDAYAVWCGPCKLMSNTVFKEKEVGEYFNQHIVALKIDVERGEGPTIKRQYSIEGLPGYLFLDSDGSVIYREKGSKSSQEFMKVVKQAKEYAADPNSIGRLDARYPKEKNNEAFLKQYLDVLKKSNSKGYFGVLEQYLKIQKSIDPASREMALLLYNHRSAVVYCGLADAIIEKYSKSDGWKAVVRKNVREAYQRLPKNMLDQTTEYAISLRDTSLLESLVKRAEAKGMPVSSEQREMLYTYYYLRTGNGEAYKKRSRPSIEAFYNSLDVAKLKELHLLTVQKQKENPDEKWRSFATRDSERLRMMIADYAKFASSNTEKADVLRWAKRAYDLVPDGWENVDFYADVQYLFGDKVKGIELKNQALLICDDKTKEGILLDLELMKAGKTIKL